MTELIKLVTKIPNLPGESMSSEEEVVLVLDENQLWSVYIGLERLKLVPALKKATDKLAGEILGIGKKIYRW